MKRLFPCPYHDIPTTVRWLESLAEKGLFLSKKKTALGFASLEAGQPRKMRYAVIPAPHTEQVIHEPQGWEYVTSRLGDMDYQIFRAPEGTPEPQTPLQDLQPAIKRSTTWFGIIAILVVGMVYDDIAQFPPSAVMGLLDLGMLALLLERACALYLLHQSAKGTRSRFCAAAHYCGAALRVMEVVLILGCLALGLWGV